MNPTCPRRQRDPATQVGYTFCASVNMEVMVCSEDTSTRGSRVRRSKADTNSVTWACRVAFDPTPSRTSSRRLYAYTR